MQTVPVVTMGQRAVDSVKGRGFFDLRPTERGGLTERNYQMVRLASEIGEFCVEAEGDEWADMYINLCALCHVVMQRPHKLFWAGATAPAPTLGPNGLLVWPQWRRRFIEAQVKLLKIVYSGTGVQGWISDFTDLLLDFAAATKGIPHCMEYVEKKLDADEKRSHLHQGPGAVALPPGGESKKNTDYLGGYQPSQVELVEFEDIRPRPTASTNYLSDMAEALINAHVELEKAERALARAEVEQVERLVMGRVEAGIISKNQYDLNMSGQMTVNGIRIVKDDTGIGVYSAGLGGLVVCPSSEDGIELGLHIGIRGERERVKHVR